MARSKWYRQCRLRRSTEKGYLETVSWLPDQFAYVNGVVNLKNHDGTWTNGWLITHVGPKRDGELIEGNSEGWKKHRRRTDV